eukprot:2020413-Prymnesium_polylepis.1
MPRGGVRCAASGVELTLYRSKYDCGANQPRCGRLKPAARKKGRFVVSAASSCVNATTSSATAPSG